MQARTRQAGVRVAGHIRQEVDDGVAVLGFEGAPGNALTPALRADLLASLDRAIDDTETRAIVLRGGAAGFSAGLDVGEYDRPAATPSVEELCSRMEDSPKPVVAALHGLAIGAGAALALAAHARVADASARLVFPDIRLGLVPCGGVTQRLPRLTGAQTAMRMLLGAQPAPADDRALRPLFSTVVPGDPLPAAVALARRLADAGRWPRTCDQTVGLGDPQAYLRSVAALRAAMSDPEGVEAAVVQCVEAALLLPFDRALELERCLFEEQLSSDFSRCARHVLGAERRATRLPGIEVPALMDPTDLTLTGRDGRFAELAIMGLDAGWRVHLDPVDPNLEVRLRSLIAQAYDAAVERGQLAAARRDERLARLIPRGAEPPAEGLWLDLGGAPAVPSGTIVAAVMQNDTPPAGSVPVWLRMQAPVQEEKPLAELAWTEAADATHVATLARGLSRLGKTVIRAAPVAGMIGGNLEWALRRAALRLLEAGHDVDRIDAAARDLGFATGPFRRMDAEGLGVALGRLDALSVTRGLPAGPNEAALRRLVAANAAGSPATGSVETMPLASLAAALHAALVNEAARLLHEKVAFRASDLDVVAIRGLGFRRVLGGPLFRADLRGIFPLCQAMRALAPLDAEIWAPHQRIEEMVRNGEGFFGRAI